MKLRSGPTERAKFRVGGAIEAEESIEVRLEETLEELRPRRVDPYPAPGSNIESTCEGDFILRRRLWPS